MKASTLIFIGLSFLLFSCKPPAETAKEHTEVSSLLSNPEGQGQWISLELLTGPSHNHPLMAVWVEDMDGNYLQPLYVAESIATGIFRHGKAKEGKWAPGERRRPAALPRWGHQRGIRASDGLYIPEPEAPLADAYTGATPGGSFLLRAKLDQYSEEAIKIFVEVNQSWDWNQYWTNVRYPGDEDYKTSAQPAVVYVTTLDPAEPEKWKQLEAAGRSHHSGKDGLLYDDLESLTTALHIFRSIRATISAP
jgi:hypothetical protein